ncbi:hypothetical protein AAFF_G00383350 [Aldrovandia affinis]|uniref:Uncharacterized protein n=1 Tax=Aldrovandia affinis TaxID=143900 RepID=A0AAD7T9J3_9TELE|nr:hypothetical protein AAFF_G00383350 [Aldrovandia affinis]
MEKIPMPCVDTEHPAGAISFPGCESDSSSVVEKEPRVGSPAFNAAVNSPDRETRPTGMIQVTVTKTTDRSKGFSIDNILSKKGTLSSCRGGSGVPVRGLEMDSSAFSASEVLGGRASQLYQMGFPLCHYLSLTCPEKVLHFS